MHTQDFEHLKEKARLMLLRWGSVANGDLKNYGLRERSIVELGRRLGIDADRIDQYLSSRPHLVIDMIARLMGSTVDHGLLISGLNPAANWSGTGEKLTREIEKAPIAYHSMLKELTYLREARLEEAAFNRAQQAIGDLGRVIQCTLIHVTPKEAIGGMRRIFRLADRIIARFEIRDWFVYSEYLFLKCYWLNGLGPANWTQRCWYDPKEVPPLSPFQIHGIIDPLDNGQRLMGMAQTSIGRAQRKRLQYFADHQMHSVVAITEWLCNFNDPTMAQKHFDSLQVLVQQFPANKLFVGWVQTLRTMIKWREQSCSRKSLLGQLEEARSKSLKTGHPQEIGVEIMLAQMLGGKHHTRRYVQPQSLELLQINRDWVSSLVNFNHLRFPWRQS